jgi:hypothetical protein
VAWRQRYEANRRLTNQLNRNENAKISLALKSSENSGMKTHEK